MKNRKLKKYILFILILFISIGFAVLTANLGISTKLNFKENVWDVHFEKINVEESTVSNPSASISSDNMTIDFSAKFDQPTDYIEFSFYVVNNGTIDAQLNRISPSLTAEQAKYISYNLKYDVDKSEVKVKDYLYVGQARKIVARYTYKYDIEEFIPLDNFTTSLSLKYIQPETVNTTVWNYEYSGTEQYFIAPATGTYKIEAWGAQGGNQKFMEMLREDHEGLGGYTSGTITLKKNEKIYLYVGQHRAYHEYHFNGGGGGESSGGGATDIRIVGGRWNDFASLKSRIMVAAGGGGGIYYMHLTDKVAGDAGGLVGYNAGAKYKDKNKRYTQEDIDYGFSGFGANQFSGGLVGGTEHAKEVASEWSKSLNNKYEYFYTPKGFFGRGGYGSTNKLNSGDSASGGGGGYFGGGWGMHPSDTWPGGGGGSSFISGHAGCAAITEASTEDNITFINDSNGVACNDSNSTGYNAAGYNTDAACSKHYSGKVFTDTVMIDGRGYKWNPNKASSPEGMPTHNGTGSMIGNTGNGYAKITLLEKKGTYDINYDLDGGTLKNKKNSYNTSDEDITLGTPTKEGYTFMGWTGGKNLFFPRVLSTTSNGITTTVLEDGTINFSGTLTDTWFNFFNLEDSKNVLKNGTHTISVTGSSINIRSLSIKGWFNSANWEYFFNIDKPKTITLSEDRKFFLVGFGNVGDRISGSIKIQIEEGSEATEYEPYISTPKKTITIPSGSKGERWYKANWEKTVNVVLVNDFLVEKSGDYKYNNYIKSYSYINLDYSPNLTYEQYLAKNADIYVFIGEVWGLPQAVATTLQQLMRAGKDVITTGNDLLPDVLPFATSFINITSELTLNKAKSNEITDKYLDTYTSYLDSRDLLLTENTDVWYKTTYEGVEYDYIGMYTSESGGRWVWSSDPFFPDKKMFIDISKYLNG